MYMSEVGKWNQGKSKTLEAVSPEKKRVGIVGKRLAEVLEAPASEVGS
jgi:hypothetical protein